MKACGADIVEAEGLQECTDFGEGGEGEGMWSRVVAEELTEEGNGDGCGLGGLVHDLLNSKVSENVYTNTPGFGLERLFLRLDGTTAR